MNERIDELWKPLNEDLSVMYRKERDKLNRWRMFSALVSKPSGFVIPDWIKIQGKCRFGGSVVETFDKGVEEILQNMKDESIDLVKSYCGEDLSQDDVEELYQRLIAKFTTFANGYAYTAVDIFNKLSDEKDEGKVYADDSLFDIDIRDIAPDYVAPAPIKEMFDAGDEGTQGEKSISIWWIVIAVLILMAAVASGIWLV